jgi:hypothetical protein
MYLFITAHTAHLFWRGKNVLFFSKRGLGGPPFGKIGPIDFQKGPTYYPIAR